MSTIFISIAAYRDQLLEKTINEAYSKAKYPNNLVFGVFEQNTENESINLNNFEFKSQIRYTRVDPELTQGVCWARSNIQDMYDNETYYFQIDSHMLFRENWDEHFINSLIELKKYHDKPIITAYPMSFDCFTFEKKEYKLDTVSIILTDNLRQRPQRFTNIGFSPPWGHSNYQTSHSMVHGYYLGACCLFSEGSFVKEIPYDDTIFFGGEEPMLALRAWTHGYNIFHISDLHVYHCWERNYRVQVQKDLPRGQSQINIKNAKNYIRRMVNGEIVGQHGIGNIRTVQQYIDFSGVDYFTCTWTDKNKSVFDKPYYEQLTV